MNQAPLEGQDEAGAPQVGRPDFSWMRSHLDDLARKQPRRRRRTLVRQLRSYARATVDYVASLEADIHRLRHIVTDLDNALASEFPGGPMWSEEHTDCGIEDLTTPHHP